jgi:hypothetical protein
MDSLCGNTVCGLAVFQMREYGAWTKTCAKSLFTRRRSSLGKDKITALVSKLINYALKRMVRKLCLRWNKLLEK